MSIDSGGLKMSGTIMASWDERDGLESNHAQYEAELSLKLGIQEAIIRNSLSLTVKEEMRSRIKIYKEMGLSPDDVMYKDIRKFFVETFASVMVDIFEEDM